MKTKKTVVSVKGNKDGYIIEIKDSKKIYDLQISLEELSQLKSKLIRMKSI